MVRKDIYRRYQLRNYYLDQATQEKENTTLSTNEIIEDTQSTQEEFNNGLSRNVLGIRKIFKNN
jgi:hypothetical protein